VPAILGGLASLVLEGARFIRPADPLFVPPVARSFQEAIVGGDAESAYDFIRARRDPNAPLDVPLPAANGTVARITPLTLGVAAGQTNVVLMLLSHGVRPEIRGNELARCLAAELGDRELLAILTRAIPAPPDCPEHVLPEQPRLDGGVR
jgi:predicted dienelactone hydrolase